MPNHRQLNPLEKPEYNLYFAKCKIHFNWCQRFLYFFKKFSRFLFFKIFQEKFWIFKPSSHLWHVSIQPIGKNVELKAIEHEIFECDRRFVIPLRTQGRLWTECEWFV